MTPRRAAIEDARPSDEQLRYVAAGLAYVVAVLHLFHPSLGLPRLVLVASVDPWLLLTDPRPLAFVLSGVAIILGVKLVLFGVSRKLIYVLGMALVATYLVGYFAWHLTGHGGFLPAREPLYHGLAPHEAVISHLRGDVWARVAIPVEVLLFAVLAVLYRRE